MKNNSRPRLILLCLPVLLTVGLAACDDGGDSGGPAQPAQENTVLSAAEVADLQLMREEEKLARDVYRAMNRRHGTPIFSNIANSEQTHMDAIAGLLRQYGVPDPALAAEGSFTNSRLGGLYQTLVARGNASAAEALSVGADIERLDIADLDDALSRTRRADIIAVYQRLRQGSENHLRAFTGGGGQGRGL